MRFMSIYKAPEKGRPPTQHEMERMGALIEAWTKSGVLVSSGGLLPSATGARVRLSKGKTTVTDGPFTETKEVVGGFAIMEAASKEAAIEAVKEFLAVAGDGECEVRQMYPSAI
jgi:hypothetical protein